MAELDDLEQELTEEEMLDMGTKTPAATVGPDCGAAGVVDLPQAPTGTLECKMQMRTKMKKPPLPRWKQPWRNRSW